MLVVYDRLANSNMVPPGPNGEYDRVFSMVVQVSAETATRLKTDDTAEALACSSEQGFDYWGFDLTPIHGNVSDPGACCDLCDSVPTCKFWSFETSLANCLSKTGL